MRVLLVDGDRYQGKSLAEAISVGGYAVDWLRDGSEAAAAMAIGAYDLAVLDQRLPGKSGIEVLRQVRGEGINLPVLMLAAADAVSDRVRGLDAGADDYLTKPCDMDELFARMRSLLRRTGSRMPKLTAGALEMDPAERRLQFNGEEVTDLTAKEFSTLELLLRNRGRFVTKARLLETSNNWREEVESNTVEVYISRLRKRFGRERIQTMRGVGYRLVV